MRMSKVVQYVSDIYVDREEIVYIRSVCKKTKLYTHTHTHTQTHISTRRDKRCRVG